MTTLRTFRAEPHMHSRPSAEVIRFTVPRRFEAAGLEAAYERLACAGTVLTLQPGETLYMEGDPARSCYEVLSGMTKESNTLEDGRHHVVAFNPQGSFFGLTCAGVHQHTAEAIGMTRLLCFPRKVFESVVSESPDLSRFVLTQIVRRLGRAEARMLGVSRLTAVERVANFLIELTEWSNGTPAAEIHIPMSRQDIADHLGLATETVCRVLKQLRSERAIHMPSPHRVRVVDPEHLRVISDWAECEATPA